MHIIIITKSVPKGFYGDIHTKTGQNFNCHVTDYAILSQYVLKTMLYVLLFVKTAIKLVVLDDNILHSVEQETVTIPVERFEVVICHHLIIAEFQSVK